MATITSFSLTVPSLMAILGKFQLRKMNKPYPYTNPDTNITTITTKVKVYRETVLNPNVENELESDDDEFLEITLIGEVPSSLYKKGQYVDFVNTTLNLRSDAKLGYKNQVNHWLTATYRAEKMVVYDPETGEVTEVGIESIKPSGESKPQETPEQQQAPTQESNKPKGNKGN